MKISNTSKFAILGLVSIEPSSGYDIKKVADISLSHFWKVSYGRLYPTLKELQSEGLITSCTEKQTGKPDRIVYSITVDGERALAEWLGQPSGLPTTRNESLLKILLGYNVPAEVSVAQLVAQRKANQDLLDTYAQYKNFVKEEADDCQQQKHFLLTIRAGELVTEARIKWCDEAIATLRAEQESK